MRQPKYQLVLLALAASAGLFLAWQGKKSRVANKPVASLKTERREVSRSSERFPSYDSVMQQMRRWASEAPDICEHTSYGKTSQGTGVSYLRIGTREKPKVLVQSGLCGNEEFGVMASMKLAERLLSSYGKDRESTWLVDNRDIYIVPVVSPDSFPVNAAAEGLDPLSSFPCASKLNPSMPSPVRLLVDFVNNTKFSAAMSFHTYGETLSGPTNTHEKDEYAISRILAKMGNLSGYVVKSQRTGGKPDDVDWLYTSGCPSIRVTWGSQAKSFVAYSDVDSSMDRMYDSLALYMREAPEASVSPIPLPAPHFYQGD